MYCGQIVKLLFHINKMIIGVMVKTVVFVMIILLLLLLLSLLLL